MLRERALPDYLIFQSENVLTSLIGMVVLCGVHESIGE